MNSQSLRDIQSALLDGRLTMLTLVENYLAAAEKIADYNAYIEIFTEEILAEAKRLDKKIKEAQDTLGPLFGAVVSIKDNLCYKGHVATAGSKILSGFKAPYSATVVTRLLAADALIIGRTNCDELSMGSTSQTSYYGPTKNAIDPMRIPGGSSGGAAVSVALDTCLVAIGSDTGGSIRQPAAFNGLLGYKPTYGAISRWGLIAYGSSLDTIGLIAKRVEDLSTTLEVVSGPDEYDSAALPDPLSKQATLSKNNNEIRIAYSAELLNNEHVDESVRQTTFAYIEKLESAGIKISEVDLKYDDYLIPTYYIVATAEASSNLSRLDGIRYGHTTRQPVSDYKDLIKLSRTEGFGKEVKKRIMLGTYVLSEGAYDAYFKKAQKVRTLIKEHIDQLLDQHDFLLMPSATTFPWMIGQEKDPLKVYLSDICTILANLCGHPAISIPIDNKVHDFPLGIQLMASSNQDTNLLSFTQRLSKLDLSQS